MTKEEKIFEYIKAHAVEGDLFPELSARQKARNRRRVRRENKMRKIYRNLSALWRNFLRRAKGLFMP